MAPKYIKLENRGIISVGGSDASSFLQGLISNDINKVDEANTIYAAMLTPQGKFLHDFMVSCWKTYYLIDCESLRIKDLGGRLANYKLRADVEILDSTEDWEVIAIIGDETEHLFSVGSESGMTSKLGKEGLVYRDPRPVMPGFRALLPRLQGTQIMEDNNIAPGDIVDYEQARILACIPDGSRDMEVGKAILVDYGFEDLNGVDFKKGCYIGQELTARTKYRGLARRRLVRVGVLDGKLPIANTPVKIGDKEVGTLYTSINNEGLALIRLDKISDLDNDGGSSVTAGNAVIYLHQQL